LKFCWINTLAHTGADMECTISKTFTRRYFNALSQIFLSNFILFEIDEPFGSMVLVQFVLDFAILIEGREEDELPEHILGAWRIAHPRMADLPTFSWKQAPEEDDDDYDEDAVDDDNGDNEEERVDVDEGGPIAS
jgi:hypothetical protein